MNDKGDAPKYKFSDEPSWCSNCCEFRGAHMCRVYIPDNREIMEKLNKIEALLQRLLLNE